MLTSWPDTTRVDPPSSNLYLSAEWLLGRHPKLAELVDRVPGLVARGSEGPDLELDTLADVVNALDDHRRAWADYEDRYPAPADDRRYEAWLAAGPTPSQAVECVAVMSRTELARLRLLATLSPDRVRFSVDDLWGFDPEGQRLIADWCLAVQSR